VSYFHFFCSYGGGSVPIIIGDFGWGSGMGNLLVSDRRIHADSQDDFAV
jgi:hypothetical protein